MKKILWIVLVLVICVMVVPRQALADDDLDQAIADEIEDEINDNIADALSTADLHELEKYYEEYAQTLAPVTDGKDLKSFITMLAQGGADMKAEDVYGMVIEALLSGLKQSIPAVVQIIIVALIFSIISHFKPSFGETGVSKAAQTAQYVIVGTMALGMLASAFSIGSGAIDKMTSFTGEFFPLMLALLTALGGITSAAILNPATVFLTTGISIFYRSFVLPLIIVLTVFTLINHFSSTIKLSGFCSLLKSIVKWGIGIGLTVFIGIVAIQGLLGSSFDGVSIKTAKFTIDKFVPIVGGLFAQSVDVVISCTLLIKNAVGIAGIIIIAGIVISPALAILAHYFLFKLTGAVLEPITGGEMGKFVQDAADVLMMLFVAVMAAAIMFFVTTAVIIGAGNANIMLR
jgi:stage III sporulation protein AE